MDPGKDRFGNHWGKADPNRGGYDCSGFVLACWKVGGVWLKDMTANRILQRTQPTDQPRPGDAAFYGRPGHASHVVLVLAPHVELVIGANGGSRPWKAETFEEYADRMDDAGARVRLERGYNYRPGLLGFRQFPYRR